MEPIYVTGHRNPDTDSIVSAMAYAALRNALGDRNFIPARLGHVSDETQYLLNRFHMEAPRHIRTVRTQVRDLEFDTPPSLSHAVTLDRAWEILQADRTIPAIPVTDDEGKLYGMLSPEDIANYDMQTIGDSTVDSIPVFNLLSVLEGEILNENHCNTDSISGLVSIALPKSRENLLFAGRENIVICGKQEDMIRRAIEEKVNCLILCQAEVDESLWQGVKDTCIISTPADPFRAARLIYHAIPVSRICRTENLLAFRLDDFVDDVQEAILQKRHKNYPILDENGIVVGCLSRYHLLRPRRKQVVLVDHNEAAQSVPGLHQADILEIIDHHRLADIQTTNPIYVRNEPVGSTATIIASMYQEKGLMPSENLAGLLAAAIVSDTVMFQSPTCTEKDRRMAERMARIARLSLDTLGKDIFSASLGEGKTAESMLFADYKEFHIAEHNFGISQITCVDADKMLARKDELLSVMASYRKEHALDFMAVMITDVLQRGTHLIFLGDEDIPRQAFGKDLSENLCFLPTVISRKKQVIPMLSALWG
ncbi:MAG: putative manganese-dependent inorganic diphosphatase [Oscillospiraceae bacterium]|nr:putative manganese-dependent inorganic diphosphatase [Oscillospiraceae bacterium]